MKSAYRSELKPVWCPGCGDFAVLSALTGALEELEVPNHQVALFSGIGCSSRIAGYVDVYGFNTLHGRAIPFARGAKLAKPDLTVLALGGDGDLFSIGGGHVAHAVRSNVGIKVICLDNFVYGLTKGQVSPTTPPELASEGSAVPHPIDPVVAVLAASLGSARSFVAQGISSDPKQLKELFVQAIRHPGFAFVNVLTCCPTYRKEPFEALKARAARLDASHDPGNLLAALALASRPVMEAPLTGIFFRGGQK